MPPRSVGEKFHSSGACCLNTHRATCECVFIGRDERGERSRLDPFGSVVAGELETLPKYRVTWIGPERETMTTLCPIFAGFLHKGFRRWNSLFINREDRQVGFGPEADIAHLSGKLPNERLR